jgi:glycerate 2-kinase
MPRLLAAFDKFRGTATATQLVAAAAGAATRSGWDAAAVPLSDGGEGWLEAAGGETRWSTVTGPLGQPVRAEWRILTDDGQPPTAVIEMAKASGIELAGGREANDPWAATTAGTGQLILEALSAGVGRILVGCGGSATTDGGLGAVEVVAGAGALADVELLVACDVTTRFVDAAKIFGPQKGATPDDIVGLTQRLERIAEQYRASYNVDVDDLPGGGAAGGLAGGLATLGARIVSGFDLVATITGLEDRIGEADLVLTGEGRLDATSLEGKVVSGVLRRVGGRKRTVIVAGTVDQLNATTLGRATGVDPDTIEIVSLSERFGADRSYADPVALVAEVVEQRLRS